MTGCYTPGACAVSGALCAASNWCPFFQNYKGAAIETNRNEKPGTVAKPGSLAGRGLGISAFLVRAPQVPSRLGWKVDLANLTPFTAGS